MPTVTLTKIAQCSGRHVTLSITGAWNATRVVHVDDIINSPLSEEEKDRLMELWLRVYCNNKTVGQLNTAFTNGVNAVF